MSNVNKKNGSKQNNQQQVSIDEVLSENDSQVRDEKYNEYVEAMTPKHSWLLNMLKAFISGGIICVIGQAFINWAASLGFDKETSGMYNILGLMLLSILLTGLNIYPKIAKFAGAGSVVPITGFANSVASPAIEFKKEGHVFGIGCKIFTIAGPVILYGIFSSWLFGLIYYILLRMNII